MGFRFPLASVLRLREIREEHEEHVLSQILFEIVQAREAVAWIDVQMGQVAARRATELSRSMQAAELHDSYAFVALLKERKLLAQDHLKQLERSRDQQIEIYQAAHRKRELLTKMRVEQKDDYLAAQTRQEQKSLDDIFSARHARQH